MTLKIAFVDLDGVVIDSSTRFEEAQLAKDKYRMIVQNELETFDGDVKKQVEDLVNAIYWQTAFDADLLYLDTPIVGAYDKLNNLKAQGYQIIFLTSRPATLHMATLEWLFKYNLDTDTPDASICELVCCAMAFRDGYIKTTVWKPGMVQQLATLFQAEEVLFIDDDEKVRDAMRLAEGTYVKVEGLPQFTVKIAASLFDSWE